MAGTVRSLRGRLTGSVLLLQVAVLIVSVLLALIPLYSAKPESRLETSIFAPIADAIVPAPGGLRLQISPELTEIMNDNPALWFYAKDQAGHVVQFGPVPSSLRNMMDAFEGVRSVEIGPVEPEGRPVAALRTLQSPAGPVQILSGGGPIHDSWSLAVFAANQFILEIGLVMTLVMLVATPLILRRELRGLDELAEQADAITFERSGERLPEDRLPLEMRSVVMAVNSALARLDDGIERRQRFLADAAHELRTPIAVLYTRIDLLPNSPERARLLLDVARLATLADQMLDLERLANGNIDLECIDLIALTREVVTNLAPLAIGEDIDIAFLPAGENVFVRGDRLALTRVLTNLVQNAISHAGVGARVEVSVSRGGEIRVDDSGPGVPEDHRQRIFEPFYRIQPSEKGAGLGLNLVQSVLRKHNGSVRVEDGRLGGAGFVVTLPMVESSGLDEANRGDSAVSGARLEQAPNGKPF